MKFITVLLKPASSLCNLACKYCFYANVSDIRNVKSYGVMSSDVIKNIVEKSINYAEGGGVNFCFQGGEPLIAGVSFYNEFIGLVNSYNTKNTKITYAIQTNGTLINDEFCSVFKENNFLVGVSLDGSSKTHDLNRVNRQGSGTYKEVIEAIEKLKKYGVEFNILTVVTDAIARDIAKIYAFYKAKGFKYLQFINCLDELSKTPLKSPTSLSSKGYIKFYKTLFDLYFDDYLLGVSPHIRYFENLIAMMQGQSPELCGLSGQCNGQLVVEGDGSVYPCDFYCVDKYKVGNILTENLSSFPLNENFIKFVSLSHKVDDKCVNCEVFRLCRGGCRRERDYMLGDQLMLNIYCTERKEFFLHVISRLNNANGKINKYGNTKI